MGSCAAPSAKGDDKFITTDYLQQCRFNCLASYGLYSHSVLLLSCFYPEYGLPGGIKFSGNRTDTGPGIKAL
jgi:hypothetical protein